MAIKWIPDVHRPKCDFSATSKNIVFYITSWKPDDKHWEVILTSKINWHHGNGIQLTGNCKTVAHAKKAAQELLDSFTNSIKKLQGKP